MSRGRRANSTRPLIHPDHNPVVAQEILDDMAEASDQEDFTLTPYEVGVILGMVDKWDATIHDLHKYMDKLSKVHRTR